MPRTLAANNIRAWHYEQLINDMALGVKSDAELMEEYGYAEEQGVRAFRHRNRADIEAKKQDLSSEYSHIWSTKKGNRLRVLTVRLEEVEAQIELLHEHARREWKTLTGVDPEASPVPLNSREYLAYVKEQRALLREIADQTGQLPQRIAVAEVKTAPFRLGGVMAFGPTGELHEVRNDGAAG